MTDAPTPDIVLHSLNGSRAIRVAWLLEELGISYESKQYKRVNMMAPPELQQVHPWGKSPILQDGPLTLIESGAIIEHLINKYGPQFKPSEAGLAANTQFTHLAESSLGATVSNKIIWSVVPSRVPFFIRPIIGAVSGKVISARLDPDILLLLNMIEEHLSKHEDWSFVAGNSPTSADFMLVFTLSLTEYLPELGSKTKAYLELIKSRPAYKAAIAKELS